jgi:peptidoglycan/LPS O-acetylase OafA/YrhL
MSNAFIYVIGKLGVIMFFVLSGFLISYLLFKEQEVTGTVSIKDFYIRRILRIWPLYFLIILSAFFIFPFIDFFTLDAYPKSVVWNRLVYKLVLYALFLPNVVLNVLGVIPYASQAWSIGAEEQFYLVWPGLNKVVKNKWLLMISVIFFYLLIKFSVYHILPPGRVLTVFNALWESTPIDCMAIGGFFAVIINENDAFVIVIRKILFSKPLQWLTLIITLAMVAKGVQIPYFQNEVYAVLFGTLICNLAANKQRIFSMENVWTNYLGKISYGMYMYHSIAIVFSIRLLMKLNILHDATLYPLVFALVVLISTVSYDSFEKKFINRKAKYSKLISGDGAKEGFSSLKPVEPA